MRVTPSLQLLVITRVGTSDDYDGIDEAKMAPAGVAAYGAVSLVVFLTALAFFFKRVPSIALDGLRWASKAFDCVQWPHRSPSERAPLNSCSRFRRDDGAGRIYGSGFEVAVFVGIAQVER